MGGEEGRGAEGDRLMSAYKYVFSRHQPIRYFSPDDNFITSVKAK